MALIKCPECGENVSDKATNCIHCGYPLSKEVGKVIFKASSDFIGLMCSYVIKDSNDKELARLKPGESYEEILNEGEAKTFYVKLKGAFGSVKTVTCTPNVLNKFSLSPGQVNGVGCTISKVDVFDSRD